MLHSRGTVALLRLTIRPAKHQIEQRSVAICRYLLHFHALKRGLSRTRVRYFRCNPRAKSIGVTSNQSHRWGQLHNLQLRYLHRHYCRMQHLRVRIQGFKPKLRALAFHSR
jgi:hypothetical protein